MSLAYVVVVRRWVSRGEWRAGGTRCRVITSLWQQLVNEGLQEKVYCMFETTVISSGTCLAVSVSVSQCACGRCRCRVSVLSFCQVSVRPARVQGWHGLLKAKLGLYPPSMAPGLVDAGLFSGGQDASGTGSTEPMTIRGLADSRR